MEKEDYQHLELIDDYELSDYEKRELYYSLSNDAMRCFDDYIFDSYQGNFIGIKRVGEETENNVEFNVTFEYDPDNDRHLLKNFTIVINEIDECIGGEVSHSIVSSAMEFSDQTLSSYHTDYYLYDTEGSVFMKVFLDDIPERQPNSRIGKRLRKLNKETESDRQIMTKNKIGKLLYILESVLDDNEINYDLEDSDDDIEGYD